MTDGHLDVKNRIQNALAVLATPAGDDIHALRRNVILAVETLHAARDGLNEFEEQLDLLTGPDRDAFREVQQLQKQLLESQLQVAETQQKLADAKRDLDIEHQLQVEERQRLADLEKKVKDFNSSLMNDDDAFSQYMDRELDKRDSQFKKPR